MRNVEDCFLAFAPDGGCAEGVGAWEKNVRALMLIVAMLNNIIDSYIVRSVLDWISIYSRYMNFTYGIFDFGAVVYYTSICVVFLFLSVRVFEKRRWS